LPDAGRTDDPNAAGQSLLDTVGDLGIGMIVFSPLAQGMLTDRYLDGNVPSGSRAAVGHFLKADSIGETYLTRARALNDIAASRGQSLAQLALTWLLRDDRVTSTLIGASSVNQLENNVRAAHAAPLTAEEIVAIEPFAVDGTNR
jgi:L-glyceraldehyde 3-phosphate reductase